MRSRPARLFFPGKLTGPIGGLASHMIGSAILSRRPIHGIRAVGWAAQGTHPPIDRTFGFGEHGAALSNPGNRSFRNKLHMLTNLGNIR